MRTSPFKIQNGPVPRAMRFGVSVAASQPMDASNSKRHRNVLKQDETDDSGEK
jgi:hypothetical protein